MTGRRRTAAIWASGAVFLFACDKGGGEEQAPNRGGNPATDSSVDGAQRTSIETVDEGPERAWNEGCEAPGQAETSVVILGDDSQDGGQSASLFGADLREAGIYCPDHDDASRWLHYPPAGQTVTRSIAAAEVAATEGAETEATAVAALTVGSSLRAVGMPSGDDAQIHVSGDATFVDLIQICSAGPRWTVGVRAGCVAVLDGTTALPEIDLRLPNLQAAEAKANASLALTGYVPHGDATADLNVRFAASGQAELFIDNLVAADGTAFIEASGGAALDIANMAVTANGVAGIDAASSSELTINNLVATDGTTVTVSATSAASVLAAAGSASRLNLAAEDGADIEARQLNADSLTVSARTGALVHAGAVTQVSLAVDEGADVTIYGPESLTRNGNAGKARFVVTDN